MLSNQTQYGWRLSLRTRQRVRQLCGEEKRLQDCSLWHCALCNM